MFPKMFYSENPAHYEFSDHQLAALFGNEIYESDEFRMYSFKIKKCHRTRSHDWTLCPFAHHSEKAKRRDPSKYNYAAVSCPDYRNGLCLRGDGCPYAHGVFEFWLHPAKYRTRMCNSFPVCDRKVCFFAHAPEELRDESEAKQYHMYCLKTNNKDENGKRADRPDGAMSPIVAPATKLVATSGGVGHEESTDFLASLSGLTISGKGEIERDDFGKYVSPEINWIADLVK